MNFPPGCDPLFPYLDEGKRWPFPPPETWKGSIIAVGGNLSPGMLLSAYERGIFPWYGPEDPILWQSPDPRMLIFPETLHVSRSMQKIFQKGVYEITVNSDFNSVIRCCAEKERPGQDGTWITGDIIGAYEEMHRLGWALSAEAYCAGELAGGCYGLLIGKVFCGESMFAKKPNASKAAFLNLAKYLFAAGVSFIDCQLPTDHLRSLGGREISRSDFLALLQKTLFGVG
ncbi:MAG: leucyl/phenylalanyl-tRNA--protein transferase [Treponema sp.]|nr:leucyl/phenylalanyl-tRNA--protein transferase [Treponema sp.]